MRQSLELARVSAQIAGTILEFRSALHPLRSFHSEDLRRFVIERVPEIAPDSPSRILRDLRKKKLLDYKIIDRRASLYEFAE
ncbi:hypothetical protein [Bradyrhizobium sp. SZCCHNS1012]|uniref:hypothetical protein n=1 Tax=Bradyrhizobium sp. SZCCHNS1012 TaxID=3057297 RepID=UPI002916392C|nr:hypothetical protein [Bradyrhizobium sp. SZCCHNS1012]